MGKRVYLILCILLMVSANVTFAKKNAPQVVEFIAFEITTQTNISLFNKIYEQVKYDLDREGFSSLTNSFDLVSNVKVQLDSNHVEMDERFDAQYATMTDGVFKLCQSDTRVGFQCDLKFEEKAYGGFVIKGDARYYVVSQREVFRPFPIADIGRPTIRMGGQITAGTTVPSKKIAKIVDLNMQLSRDRLVKKITGLLLVIDRDVSHEDATAYKPLFGNQR